MSARVPSGRRDADGSEPRCVIAKAVRDGKLGAGVKAPSVETLAAHEIRDVRVVIGESDIGELLARLGPKFRQALQRVNLRLNQILIVGSLNARETVFELIQDAEV